MTEEVIITEFQKQINESELNTFHPDSPLWIYSSNRSLNNSEAAETVKLINDFTNSWLSHGNRVKPFGKLFFNRFVVLGADSAGYLPSGCSVDSSVHFIKGLGQRFDIDFFDRMLISWIDENQNIRQSPLGILSSLKEKGELSAETLIFDNTINKAGAFQKFWIRTAADSWMKRILF